MLLELKSTNFQADFNIKRLGRTIINRTAQQVFLVYLKG
ncbi:hypothetical protein KP78_36670 [Jeotgalibacillus soli]|uniref:Uncharacterized protein n=1 Tax=Jeotgalibacillus soli TaxID=889306 RepID=A0A0C2VIL0_9BACL|nr:hypothetical protein KP78_36670 [Jeotgalibacillus soli]